MIHSRVPSTAAALALLAVLAGCSRAVSVQSEPGPAFTMEVVNMQPDALVVSYDDGAGTRLLGTVEAGSTQRFVITSPARTTIRVTATDEDRTYAIQRDVALSRTSTVRVSLAR